MSGDMRGDMLAGRSRPSRECIAASGRGGRAAELWCGRCPAVLTTCQSSSQLPNLHGASLPVQ